MTTKQQRKEQQWQSKQAKYERKFIVGELKATNDSQGIVEGYLNAIGNVDYGKDRTMPGAFKRTLTNSHERKKNDGDDYLWPYLWNHDYDLVPPGGIFDAEEDKKGLFIKAQLNLDYDLARNMYSSFKAGTLKKQSMGYICHQSEYVKEAGEMVRNLIEVEVLEGSGVVFPMNDLADVTGVKRHASGLYVPKYWPGYSKETSTTMTKKTAEAATPQRKDFNDRYREEQIADWKGADFQNLVLALQASVMEIFAIGDEPQDDAINTVLEGIDNGSDDPGNKIGFIDALKAYIQKGIDLDVSNYLNSNPYFGEVYSYGSYGYMSRRSPGNIKAGASFSQSNTDAIHDHVKSLHDMADAQCKSMHDAADALVEALSGLGAPSSPSFREQGTTSDDEKALRRILSLIRTKSGAEFSEANLQMLGQHVGGLHDVADTLHQMAEDLAENTGATTYVDPDGNTDPAKQTDTDKAASHANARRKTQHSPTSTAESPEDWSSVLTSLKTLKTS